MNDQQLELRNLVEIINRHRKVVYYVFAAAIVIALLINVLSTPVYESNVGLRIKSWTSEATRTSFPEELSRQQIYTYAEIVKSRAVIEGVINKLYAEDADKPDYERMSKRIRLQPVRESEILNVYAQAPTAQEAQAVADTLLTLFTERITEMARSDGKEARAFLAERLTEAKRNLDKAEQDLVVYKKNQQTVAISDQTKTFLERQSLIKKMDIESKMMLDTARARLSSVSGQINRQNPGFVGDSSLIQQYRNKLAEQEIELIGMRGTYAAQHPKVIALQAAIENTKAKLSTEITKVVNAEAPSSNPVYQGLLQNRLQAEVDVAVGQAQQAALNRAISTGEQELKLLPDKEQGLARLMRDYSVAEESYVSLAKRYDQARIDEVMQPTNVQVVDTAGLPDKPIRPRKFLNILIAAFLGLLGGIMAAFLAEHFFKTIDTNADVNRYLGTTVLGSVPSARRYPKETASV